tara:strand:- start:540 stop:824 length:285 start_codon:yes stop_codon:yes gene_type:complete
MPVSFVTAVSLVHELMEARDDKRLLRLQRQLEMVKMLIFDKLGFVPLSKNWGGTSVRAGLAALRTRFHADHQQLAVRRMDGNIRHGTPDWCSAG